MFKNQPAGLYVLSLANTGERFGYYTMLAIFLFYLQAKFGFDATWTGQIFSIFLALVYFMPLMGGWLADKWSFSKCVVTGIAVMFIGYALMSAPTPVRSDVSMMILFAALLLISVGTGLFKGNLQVMVGDLYNNSRYGDRRDAAFSLFYMAINLGSMFAPMAAVGLKNLALSGKGFLTDNPMAATVCNWCIDTDSFTNMPADPEKIKAMTEFATQNGMAAGGDLSAFLTGYLTEFAGKCSVSFDSLLGFANDYITTFSTGCSYAFALACGSLIISFLIYTFGRRTYAHIITDKKNNAGKKADASTGKELTPSQTKQRVVALLLVFAVVIFFWMVFHQNGQTLTEFAKSCTTSDASGWTRIGFNIWALVAIAAGVYALFGLIQSTTTKARAICGGILVAVIAAIWYIYSTTPAVVAGVDPAMYQQFNPFYVVALTPFSMALFAWLGKKGKEPSAPRKIGYGMIMAGAAYGVMVLASLNLVGTNGSVSPDWLISTYLLLTFAELLLSPMGISFVSKVAPPKLKGSMMGGWFAATAVGNYLVSIPMLLWGKIPVSVIWGILIVICLISAAFIFSIMKKLEAATSDAPAADADQLETVEDDAI
ncbi:peptide MFS transporter [Heminiphilus faecis]|jgi:POT family proton-dependent oligopeptide transporter|uniref:Peptide MFS transporter n=1 Tax=Heminiphilus faecis TaxID=2601703 RepID=A0ABV4CXC0_9BACT|nr:peptide MFS transporter [Heminiphilus faecis]RLT75816.1 MFS transporter [bacterium J10(2018)]